VRGVEGDLHDACSVAEVDENETAEIASAMNPPAESHGRSHMGESQ
jgi:hypothetical protein